MYIPYSANRPNWFLVKMVYRIICGDGEHAGQFDEQLRLISAPGKLQAFEKACTIGKQEEDVFPNAESQLVRWEFISVTDVFRLNPQQDGAEIYSRIEEREPAGSYVQILREKAKQLCQNLNQESGLEKRK